MNTPFNLQPLHPRSKQRGMGLVELMISLVISLVLLGALTYFYLGSQQMNRTHEDVSRMQESGRNAMEILGKAVRQAGSKLDLERPFIGAIIGTNGDGATDVMGSAALADTITIQHDPTWMPTADNPMAGDERDCENNRKISNNDSFDSYGMRAANTQLVAYAFSISVSTTSATRTLRCNSTANNPATGGQIIADNIENMQITYGIGDGLGAITSYKAQPTAAEFANVAAVRVSLLIRGPSANVTANKSQTYTYNGAKTTATDGFLRHVYTSTFTVRNQAF